MATPSVRGNNGTNFNNSESATTLLLTKPVGTLENEVMYVLIELAVSTGTPGLSGWTIVTNQNQTHDGGRTILLRKVAGSGEPTNYTFTWTGGSRASGSIITIIGADTTTPETATPTPATGSTNGPDPPASGTVAIDDYLALACAGQEGKMSYTPPSGYAEETDVATTGGGAQTTHCGNSMATLGLSDQTDENPGFFLSTRSDGWATFTVLIKPAPELPDVFEFAGTRQYGGLPPMKKPEMVAY